MRVEKFRENSDEDIWKNNLLIKIHSFRVTETISESVVNLRTGPGKGAVWGALIYKKLLEKQHFI